jgi:DNA uptake protein ComE-like DNA-binding protein
MGPFETAEILAKERIRRRERCRRLVISNPNLAEELLIGRPDLSRDYDDGGPVDINHVPQQFLSSLPGIDPDLATKIMDMREFIGGFDSLDDMEVLLGIAPQRLDAARDYVIFVR